MFSMAEPLTAAEVVAAVHRLRVDRPLHWSLARRLLAEVLRLRPDLLTPTLGGRLEVTGPEPVETGESVVNPGG